MLTYIVAAIKEQREKEEKAREESRTPNPDAHEKETHPKMAA